RAAGTILCALVIYCRTDEVQNIGHNPRRRVVRHHISIRIAVLVSRRRWRNALPVRLRNRLDRIPSRNRLPPHKSSPLLTLPVVYVLPVIPVEVVAVLMSKPPVVILL